MPFLEGARARTRREAGISNLVILSRLYPFNQGSTFYIRRVVQTFFDSLFCVVIVTVRLILAVTAQVSSCVLPHPTLSLKSLNVAVVWETRNPSSEDSVEEHAEYCVPIAFMFRC